MKMEKPKKQRKSKTKQQKKTLYLFRVRKTAAKDMKTR